MTKEIIYLGNGNLYETYEYNYDTDGNLIEEIYYRDEDGYTYLYDYDIYGNVIKRIENMGESDEKIREYSYDYSYDDLDNLTCVIAYYEEKESSKTYYEYKNNGNLSKSIKYYSGGKSECEYDNNGNPTKVISYHSEDESSNISEEYEYDKNGNLTKHTNYNNDGSIWCGEEYEYDNNGNVLKETNFSGDDLDILGWSEYVYE